MQLKMKHILCWNVFLYNPIRNKFPSFHNVVLGSLKSYIQLNHQVDINLYPMEAIALCHLGELVGLKPS